MTYFPYCAAAWLFVIGLYGIVTSKHMVHLIVCVSVVQSSTYLLLLSIGFRNLPAQAPIFSDVPTWSPAVDPVVHSLTLTDIVVSATVSALLLALVVDVQRRRGSVNPDELSPFRDK